MKKVICLVSEEYPEETNFGGIATYNKQIATLLRDNGYKVIVLTRSLSEKKEIIDDNITIIRIKPYLENISFLEKLIGYRLSVYKNLKSIIKKYNVNIIESPDWKGELFFFFLLRKHKKIPTIIRLHGCRGIIRKYDKNQLTFGDRIVIAIESYILKRTEYITSSSFENLKETEEVLNISVKNKSTIIHNFLDNSIVRIKKKEHNKKKILLFVGRLDYLKGIFTISDIIPEICKRHNDVIFRFVGKDSYNSKMNEYNSKLIIKNVPKSYRKNIDIVGAVPKEEVNKYYSEAYVTIIPSYYESFSYTCIESMYQGTPVIGSSNGGIREIIKHKKDGLLFNPLDSKDLYEKVEYLLNNEEVRNKLSDLAIKKIENEFLGSSIIDKIDNYFNSIIN